MKKCVKNLFTEEENVELVSFDQQGCDHKICVEHFVNEGKNNVTYMSFICLL